MLPYMLFDCMVQELRWTRKQKDFFFFFNLYFNINAIPHVIEIRERCFILFILHRDEIRAGEDSSTRQRKGGAARGGHF